MQFEDYAAYYNVLYKDKDYYSEAGYIDTIIRQNKSNPKSMIDLGCGTGNHVFEFERRGYSVTGVDISKSMLAIANKNKQSNQSGAFFYEGDIRNYKDGNKYDAVISLFHVMSYQTTNADFAKAISNAAELMNKDGVFIFDCWYGPGVLNDLPGNRTKRFEDEILKVERRSVSKINYNSNTVEVNFEINIENKSTEATHTIKEVHRMRYFFWPEIEFIAQFNGFKIESCYNWMTTEQPSENSWYVVFILKRV